MDRVRYLQAKSLTKFNIGNLEVDYPADVYKLYWEGYAPKYIKAILQKWEKGKELNDRDYYNLIKKSFSNPYKTRAILENGDLASLCGIGIQEGKFIILEEARQEVETKTLRFFLEQILEPYTTPIISTYFPKEEVNLGYWQDQIDQGKLELDQTIKIAYIFTLYNYLWNEDVMEKYGFFLDYYQKELDKRIAFIKRMWDNRRPGEGLEYIPIFEDFRNLNPEKSAFMAQMISRILKNQDLQASEKAIIEEALFKHAKAVLNCHDEEAREIQNSLLTPVVSEIVSLKKSKEFLMAAENCATLGLYNSVINRCYYGMLRGARAALVNMGYVKPWRGPSLRPIETHEEVINSFNKILVYEKRLLPGEDAKTLKVAFQKRLVADYGDLEITEFEAKELLKGAQNFINNVEKLISDDRAFSE